MKSPPEFSESTKSKKSKCIFDDFDDGVASDEESDAGKAKSIRDKCRMELNSYLQPTNSQQVKNGDGDFNNPLKWWSVNEGKFPLVAKLAIVFLAIPATSAPSERVWSRASQVLSIKRASLDPAIASRIMFIRENIRLVYKYYEELTGLPVSSAYLPSCDDVEVDAGQDDHLLQF